jgi:hypothetical protein
MKAVTNLNYEFVEYIPDDLKVGTLYVSITFATAVHKCCCGCGNEVVTPLSPTDWKITFDGESISLDPSIGNWSFDCRSHYWIENSTVRWARRWSREQIDAGRAHDRLAKKRYFDDRRAGSWDSSRPLTSELAKSKTRIKSSFWSELKKWWT